MSLLVLLQLLMFVSAHACKARSLGVVDKDLKIERGGATTKIHKDCETFLTTFSGIKSIVNSKIATQQEVHLIQEMKRHGRSLGESKSKTTDEESVESNENETVEDVVVMDYASPHRKPPIHNEKP